MSLVFLPWPAQNPSFLSKNDRFSGTVCDPYVRILPLSANALRINQQALFMGSTPLNLAIASAIGTLTTYRFYQVAIWSYCPSAIRSTALLNQGMNLCRKGKSHLLLPLSLKL